MSRAVSATTDARNSGGQSGSRPNSISVLIADDHAIVRAATRTLIEGQSDMCVVGEAGDARAALEAAKRLRPRIVLLDLSMPHSAGAIGVASEILRTCPGTRVVVLTMHEDVGNLRALLAAGASGYVLKRSASSDLLHALRAVDEGGVYLDPTLAGRVVHSLTGRAAVGYGAARASPAADATDTADYDDVPASASAEGGSGTTLSEREEEVLRRIAQGYSNKEVAAQLSLSVKTVETYKARSMEKLGLGSRVDIVRYARDEGWLERV